MNDAIAIEQVRAIQASMVESGRSYFLESELDDLCCLIRCDSVFSGVDSFGLVSAAYRVLPGAGQTTITWDGKSVDSLKEEFVSKYSEFSDETNFEKRCRLLLDLFKLQIVFAGLSY